jgi:diaminohydroxyphosphoribosylaminopyrimidine deaminase/5-amino-6-(5-phosphoribosylamino)uracil reductase
MYEQQFMHRAIELAAQGSGYVSPNPMVGAVLVCNDRIIGEGWHAIYGDVHAEVACLESVLEEDRHLIPESTMYVTLEPCAHQGRQPPCAHRLVREGIRKVVIAVKDPFPQVSGKGIGILKEAGVEVELGVCNSEGRWMCRRFLSMHEQQRPYVILKWAQSCDGYLAPKDKSRLQLSNAFSQTLVHKWRTEESAIMVGYNTALADNPHLTARNWKGKQPLRIVLDRNLQLPVAHHLFDRSVETWVINEMESAPDDQVCRIKIPFNANLIPELLQKLSEAGRTSLFVEGGAHLLDSIISAGFWDEARVFTAPEALGSGIAAPALVNANPNFRTSIGNDELRLYRPLVSLYPYTPGAIL